MAVKPKPICVDDFTPISKLVNAYELKPGHAYLIVCDAEKFSMGKARSLLKDILEMHPDVEVAVVATSAPKSIDVRERVKSSTEESAPEASEGLFPTE